MKDHIQKRPSESFADISVVIPVRNRWLTLNNCLRSLDGQQVRPQEVIVVDDGSTESAPEALRAWQPAFSLRIISGARRGVAAARNLGVDYATRKLILFTDSDCVLAADCISELAACAAGFPGDPAFQLAFAVDDSKLVWCIDGLGKSAKQRILQTPAGSIKYLDTAGFAIRREFAGTIAPLFSVADIRGEDTSLLARLAEKGILPRFTLAAKITHQPVLRFAQYLSNHFTIGYRTSPARDRLRSKSTILMNTDQRFAVLREAWSQAKAKSRGRAAFVLLLLASALEVVGRSVHRLVGVCHGQTNVFDIPIDSVSAGVIESCIISAAEKQQPLCITYLHAWSLVQARTDPDFRGLLRQFDLRYPDGMGVVLSAFMLNLRWLRKVTANDFIFPLCHELAQRNLSVALVGGTPWTADETCRQMRAHIPHIHISFVSSGYLSEAEVIRTGELLRQQRPRVIILAMGQPKQERLALQWRQAGVNAVFLCVGGLFDYICGVNSTPPLLVRRCGFEWLWRLVHSPRRMWSRYLLGLPTLGVFILRELAGRFFRR